MRRADSIRLPLFFLLAACARGPAPFTEADRAGVAEEVTRAVGQLTAAMSAGDAAAVLAFYRETEDFTYLGCTDFILGGKSFARIVGPSYQPDSGVTFEQNIVRLEVVGPDAAVASLRGGSTAAEHLFWTQLWVRDGERWMVAIEHESWPGCRPPSGPHPMTSVPDSDAEAGSR